MTVAYDKLGMVDPTQPGFLDDPYPHLSAAREHAPVQRHPRGVYMLFRYDDVKRGAPRAELAEAAPVWGSTAFIRGLSELRLHLG